MRSNGFDLMKLANALRGQGRYRDLSENIERAYTAASAATDLHRVKNSLDLISKVQKKGGAPEGLTAEETGIVIAGQFLSAVITYSRATVSKPIARRLWWNPATLPPELKSTHDLILHLRNKEFAHFGKGRRVGEEPLLTEILYLALGSDSPVNFRSSQWSTRPEVIPEFSILNDHVLRVAKSRMNSGFIFIAEKIASIVSYDNSFWDLAGMSPIDISGLGEPQGEGSRDGKAVTRNWTKIVSRPMGKLAISDEP